MSGAQIMPVISIPHSDIKTLQQRLQCAWEGIRYLTGLTNVFTIKENTKRINSRKQKSKAKETQRAEKRVGKIKIKKKKEKTQKEDFDSCSEGKAE